MSISVLNALALVRFGGFRMGHSAREGFELLLIGMAFVAVVVWAISRPTRNAA